MQALLDRVQRTHALPSPSFPIIALLYVVGCSLPQIAPYFFWDATHNM